MKSIFYDSYGLRPFWAFFVGAVGITVLTGAVIFAGANFVDKPVCERTAAKMGVNSNWGFWHGCLIEVDGKVVPLSNYIVNNETGDDNE